VLIIISKLSNVFGRKSVLVIVILLFAVFSGACGAAQSIEQLSVRLPYNSRLLIDIYRIVFRAFQGIGGAGNYALCSVILLELVPSHKYAKYTNSISVVNSISLLLGAILGGAISERTTWQWVFLLK
jgi:MFS family permease